MLLNTHCTSSQTLLKMCWKSPHCGICCSPGENLIRTVKVPHGLLQVALRCLITPTQLLTGLLLHPLFLYNRDSPFALDNNSGGGFGESPVLAPKAAATAAAAVS
jgi:hypothetical protein